MVSVAAGQVPRLRESQEFQSALIRFLVGAVALAFLVAGDMGGYFDVPWLVAGLLYGIHLALFVALLGWVCARPRFHRPRSDLSILADLSAISSLVYLSGDPLGPLYLIYVVLFLSQGTRHGRRNLTLAAVGSVASFALVVTLMGGWQHPVKAGLVVAVLAVLPIYQDALLRNLQRQRERAEAANAARGDFLATMSHELRTPLAGMLGTARLLHRTGLDGEQRRHVDSLCSSGETLQALIGDILDLSKVDAGGLALDPERFDLRQSLLEVCRNLGREALSKGVELVCCIDGALPECVHGDRVRFEQILYNLVGNAVKFTPAGRVCVKAERGRPHRDLPSEHLEIVIGDTGIGIPRERLDCVFDSFWQADTRSSRHYGGTGLGTTIAHRLTRAMGGHIMADSEENRGTTFRVRLPLLPEGDDDRPPQPPRELRGRRVLVYEGDPESRGALEASCRQGGMDVRSCCDERELERRLAALGEGAPIDLALIADSPVPLDLDAIAARLRGRVGGDLAIVYVAYGSRLAPPADDRVAAVAKPWHPVEIWDAMRRTLAARHRSAPGRGAGAAAQGGDAAPRRRVLVVEDDPVNAAIVDHLLSRRGYAVMIAADGASALARVDDDAFDLLLVDLRMPGMDGFEFTRRVRAREHGSARRTIVALTASAESDRRNEGRAAGMDAFLEKPIDPDRLEDLIRELALA